MSFEEAMIRRAQPQAFARRLNAAIEREVIKGCMGDISPVPVQLEPLFSPFLAGHSVQDVVSIDSYVPASPEEITTPTRLRIWISPEQKFDWNRSELWIKQLAMASGRVAFQIVGNSAGIEVAVRCTPCDELLVRASFEAQFSMCEITLDETARLECVSHDSWEQAQLLDFYPPPPYSHILTSFLELRASPFEALLTTMRLLPNTAIAFYQCVFQPVHPSHNWHRNVNRLFDFEYLFNQQVSPVNSFRSCQPTPGNDEREKAKDVENKAHNDKPFFATVVRMGVAGSAAPDDRFVRALASTLRVFQHGGRPLEYVCQDDYRRHLGAMGIRRLLVDGLTHRAGFLVNSQELAGLVHVLPASILEPRKIKLETLPLLPFRSELVAEGTRVGTCRYAGIDRPVCISDDIRRRSVYVIACPDMGKTTVKMNMFLQDIATMGSVFFDPHGDAIKDLLKFIPPACRSRCIYFNPGDRDWIPLWNPLRLPPGGDVYRLADDLVSVCKRVFEDWGDRLEHVIRNGLIGLGHLPNVCLADLYTLMRQKTDESDAIRRKIVSSTVDEPVRKFWEKDFLDYNRSDLHAPKHKLSKLVSAGPVSLMLSQSESLINFRDIMDNKQILLVDLSNLGAEVRDILGSFMLSVFLTTTVGRSDTGAALRQPFSIFVDEAHLFVSADAIEQLIVQARKFNVRLCLANQYLRQFPTTRIDAVTAVGCTLVGKVDDHDSQIFARHLQGKVEPKTIMAQERGQMIARIGSEIVQVTTQGPPTEEFPDGQHQIIEESHRRYCRPAGEVRQLIRRRGTSRQEAFAALDDGLLRGAFTDEDLHYEEF